MNELKAYDLRIGNLVRERKNGIMYTNTGTLIKGCYVSKPMQHGDYFLRYEELEGLPITPEWLQKLGFSTMAGNYTKSIELDSHLMLIQSPDGFYPQLLQDAEMSSNESQCVSLYRAESVHQLQNLYYTISGGQELTIGEQDK